MMQVNEVQSGKSQIQYALAALDASHLKRKTRSVPKAAAIAQTAARPGEINLSGPQFLAGVMFALSFMTLFAWAFVRYWLFAP